MLLELHGFPEGHPFRTIRAMPADAPLPPIYLLGSSGYSAELAAMIGAGFAFAHHFATYDAVAAMTAYRTKFRPSAALARPHAILGVAAVAADTDAEADRLATTIDLNSRGGRRASTCRWPVPRRPRPIRSRRPIAKHPPQPRPCLHRHGRDRAKAPRSADRGHQGRRANGDHHDLRSRRPAALICLARRGVRLIRRRAGGCRRVMEGAHCGQVAYHAVVCGSAPNLLTLRSTAPAISVAMRSTVR